MPPPKRIEARLESGMRFAVRTGSGHEIVVDNAEGNAGPRPTEHVLVALASCAGMDVASILAKKRQSVDAYRVEITAHQREERPDVFTWIEIVHVVEGHDIDEDAVRRAIELSATTYCPVSAMLSAGPSELHHRYRIEDAATDPPTITEAERMVTGPYREPEPQR